MVKNLALAAIVATFATTAFAETEKKEATTVKEDKTTTTTAADPADAEKTAKEEAKK